MKVSFILPALKLCSVVAGLSLLAACQSAPSSDQRASLMAKVDLGYSALVLATTVYASQPSCRDGGPPPPLCSNPVVVAEIAKAQSVAQAVVDRARVEIMNASDQSVAQRSLQLALDALAIYAKAMSTYGLKT